MRDASCELLLSGQHHIAVVQQAFAFASLSCGMMHCETTSTTQLLDTRLWHHAQKLFRASSPRYMNRGLHTSVMQFVKNMRQSSTHVTLSQDHTRAPSTHDTDRAVPLYLIIAHLSVFPDCSMVTSASPGKPCVQTSYLAHHPPCIKVATSLFSHKMFAWSLRACGSPAPLRACLCAGRFVRLFCPSVSSSTPSLSRRNDQ